MSTSYYYLGHDTLTNILVGHSGRSNWRFWGLMDQPGPFFNLDNLGYGTKRSVYLPLDLLEFLYTRFRAANPSGATLTYDDESLGGNRYTEQEREDMYERREAFFSIDVEESWEGYPYVRPYLPELYEPITIERLANDPWLDCQLLRWAEFLGPDRGGIRHDLWVDRSARWSPEWRAFCDKLTPLDWSAANSWKESTLHPQSRFYLYRDSRTPYWLSS